MCPRRSLSATGIGASAALYSTAKSEGRLHYMSGTREGVEKLLSLKTPAAMFEYQLSMGAEQREQPCQMVEAREIRVPGGIISLPLKKGEGRL